MALPNSNNNSIFFIIDGSGLIHRAFHALPEMQTSSGEFTNAVYGFASMLYRITTEFSPTYLAVCFDTPFPTFRKKLYQNYQIQRPPTPDKLKNQFPLVRKMLQAANIPYFEKEGFEADDIIGTIVEKIEKENHKVFILSGDRDIFQLVKNNIIVIFPKKGISQLIFIDEDYIIKNFEIKPWQFPDWKALVGDQSDNYPGVKGIGPKTASKLLQDFENLESIYQSLEKISEDKIRKSLIENKDQAFLAKKLATIVKEVPIKFSLENCRFKGYNEPLKEFFQKLEFKSLISRFFENKKQLKKEKFPDKDQDQMSLF